MIELDLTAEDWACALLRRVTDDDWRPFRDAGDRKALAAPPARRIRRPTLEVQLRQVWKAARAAGVPIAVTIEGDSVTATPPRGIAPPNRDDRTVGEPRDEPPRRSLFKARTVPKQKVVL